MNSLTIIGNLTRDPELRTTSAGKQVCSFTVAVNRRRGQNEETDFFRVTTWRELAETCAKFLAKGRKVAVVGSVSQNTYTAQDGAQRASMEVTATEVEFLSPAERTEQPAAPTITKNGFVEVKDEELPWG
jgi:single-strand DNA-binding protein